MRNFHEELNALIRDLIALRRVWHSTSPKTGERFVTLLEDTGTATLWRFDAQDGFIFCGEVK